MTTDSTEGLGMAPVLAWGRLTLTPWVMSGAVTMKITSSTSITSM
jgi:hypothetical protein